MAKKILVVEPLEALANLVAGNLRKAGYEAEVALRVEGTTDLTVLKERFDMVITAVGFSDSPDAGFALLKRLQGNPKTERIPVVMLTAKGEDRDIFRGWQSGVSSYLTKPFSPRELLTFVRRIFKTIDEPEPAEDLVWEA